MKEAWARHEQIHGLFFAKKVIRRQRNVCVKMFYYTVMLLTVYLRERSGYLINLL